MVRGDPFVAHGPYYIEQGQVRAPNGTSCPRAKTERDTLSLTSWGKGGSYPLPRGIQIRGIAQSAD